MRSIGLDVHRDFCEVAIVEGSEVRSAGRIATSPESIGLFAGSLCATDQVVLETTSGAIEIARLLRPHVARVVLANAADVRAIAHARVKCDRFDAATLARLLAAGMIDGVWVPDERVGALRRRIARRAALVRQRTRAKNEVHAVIMRCLLGRPPASDLFGKKGRAWLAAQQLPAAEVETVEGCLRQVDFLGAEIAAIDAKLAEFALTSVEARRLMTIPGVDVAAACTLIAAIGDIRRFDSPRKLAAYLGLDPRVRQSGEKPARHGRISKRGNPHARHVLVEAAWQAMRTRARCAHSVSASARAREPRSPPLPSRARSPRSPGRCSPAARTTPSRARRWCARRSATPSSRAARRGSLLATPAPVSASLPMSASATAAPDAGRERLPPG